MNEIIRQALAAYGHLTKSIGDIGDTDDLYQAGLSSHATVNVMLALEDELGIEFSDDLLRRDTFATIAALDAVVQGIVGTGSGATR